MLQTNHSVTLKTKSFSSDVVGMTYGSLFDATQTRVMSVGDRQLVKVAAWYDNEMSYTAQLVRTLAYLAELSK